MRPYYRELYAQLTEEYGKDCCLPPESTPADDAPWERPPRDLPKPRTFTVRAPKKGGDGQ